MDRMQEGRIIHCLILVAVICASMSRVVAIFTDIRLVDGPSPNEGRLEVSDPAQGWGTVCSTGWDIKDTEVVCRELGFQGANSFIFTGSPFGQGSAPILITNVDCNGNESSLNDCTFDETSARCTHQQDVGIICHKPGYIGCFGDSFQRLFQGASFVDLVGMTIDACLGFCRNQNFPFAGVEYATECYCADSDTRYDAQGTFDDLECQYICSGNTLERCGGNRRISVFNTTVGFCEDPGEPEYGTRQGDWFRYGASVTFDCAEGYNLTGNQSAQCLSVDGSPSVDWNADTPVCLGPTVIPTTIVPSTAGPTTEDASTAGFFTTQITDASTTAETPASFTTDGTTTTETTTPFTTDGTTTTETTTPFTTDGTTTTETTTPFTTDGTTTTETTTPFTTDETSAAVPTTSIDPTTSPIITTTDNERTTTPNSVTTTEASITTDKAATTQSLETTTDITATFKTTTVDSITTEIPPTTTTKATEETDITLDVSTDTTTYESTGTTGTMTSAEEVDTTGPPDGSTQATPTIPSTTEDVTPEVASQGGRWPWPPMAIGFLLGGIILFLLIVVFVICLVVISPRAKAKKEEVKAVRLRNAARHSPAGNSYSPNIVLDRDGRRSVRSNGIQRVEESETYDNGAFLADDASIIGVYGERQRAVENPYATFRTDDTAKKILFADTARKLNQIYVPGSPNLSTVSRGTRRSSSDLYGAQLVV